MIWVAFMRTSGFALLVFALSACNASHAPPVEIMCGDEPVAGCCAHCSARVCDCSHMERYECDSGAWICPDGTLDTELCVERTAVCTTGGI